MQEHPGMSILFITVVLVSGSQCLPRCLMKKKTHWPHTKTLDTVGKYS